MPRVSIIIPSRAEGIWFEKTVADILAKATGDIEILAMFDGPPYHLLPDDPRVRRFELPQEGLRPCVNLAASLATGEYLMKVDAHCSFALGFDETLSATVEPNWIVMPRFYVLDAERWAHQDERFYDYFHLCCPLTDPKQYRFQGGGHWPERTQARLSIGPLDETMEFHGSCWFTSKEHFTERLGGLSSEGYGPLYMETFEMGLKTWLGPWDGRIMVNKATSYAHMHKGRQRPRGYGISWREARRSYDWTAHHWMENREPHMAHDIGWLIDRFMPIPRWPENWRVLQSQYEVKRYGNERAVDISRTESLQPAEESPA